LGVDSGVEVVDGQIAPLDPLLENAREAPAWEGEEDTAAMPEEDWQAAEDTPPQGTGPPNGATRVLSADPERDKKTRVVQAPPPPRFPPKKKKRAAVQEEDSILSRDFEIAVTALKAVYKRLRTPEVVALWATVAAFVFAFSPWYKVKRFGWVSGIESQGWIPAVLTGLSLVLLYLRFSFRWGILPALGQFVLTAGAAMAAIYFVVLPGRGEMLFGLPATAAASSVAAVAVLLGMLSRT
jgi:hypothetical protein